MNAISVSSRWQFDLFHFYDRLIVVNFSKTLNTHNSHLFVLFSFIVWAGLVDFVEFELDCRLDKLP